MTKVSKLEMSVTWPFLGVRPSHSDILVPQASTTSDRSACGADVSYQAATSAHVQGVGYGLGDLIWHVCADMAHVHMPRHHVLLRLLRLALCGVILPKYEPLILRTRDLVPK